MRVVEARMGTLQEVEEYWSIDDLAAAHRSLWLKEQLKQHKWATIFNTIAQAVKKR